MVLFISDIHFGRSSIEEDRIRERNVLECLHYYENELTALFLVGDIFEQYIEYKHLIPKGFIRFQSYLAQLADRNIPVFYVVGNHDPWHLDYFQEELGIKIVFDYIKTSYFQCALLITHGDGCESLKPFQGFMRRFSRHSWIVKLYRMMCGGDSGFALARWVSKTFHSHQINPQTVKALQTFAQTYLSKGFSIDLQLHPVKNQCNIVVMGHSHQAELTKLEHGFYLNTGFWHQNQTFGILTEDSCALLQWQNGSAISLTKQSINN